MIDPYRNSALQCYRDCATRYKFDWELNLVQIGRGESHDVRYGVAFHAAMATLYTGSYGAATLQRAWEAFKDAYPADQYPGDLVGVQAGKTQQNAGNALWDYARTTWRQDCIDYEVLEVETQSTPAGQGEYDRTLTLDLVLRDKRSGGVIGVDHKTVGKYLNDEYWSKYEPSSQVRMYAADVKARYGSFAGFVINGFSMMHRDRAYTPRKGPNKGVQLPAGDWFEHARMAYHVNQRKMDAEEANLRATVDQIAASRATNTWSYNTDRCHGNSMFECPYYRICEPAYAWEDDRELIEEWYRVVCGRRVGNGRCQRDPNHDGDHDATPQPDAQPVPVVPFEMPALSNVED